MNHTPKILLRMLLVISLFCLATSAAGMFLAARGQAWYTLAFEAIVLVTALPCVFIGLGRVRSGPAMAMLCLGGVLGVCTTLIDPQIVKTLARRQMPAPVMVGGMNVVPWVLLHLVIAKVLCLMAGLTLLLRRRERSFPLLFRGIAFGLPVLIFGAAMLSASLRARLMALPSVALMVLALLLMVVLGVLISASGHYLIRAFQIGIDPEPADAKK